MHCRLLPQHERAHRSSSIAPVVSPRTFHDDYHRCNCAHQLWKGFRSETETTSSAYRYWYERYLTSYASAGTLTRIRLRSIRVGTVLGFSKWLGPLTFCATKVFCCPTKHQNRSYTWRTLRTYQIRSRFVC